MIHMNLFTDRNRPTDLKQIYGYQRKKDKWGRDKLRVWDWHANTTIYKIDNRQGPTRDTGNTTQYSIVTNAGKETEEKGQVYTYSWIILLHTWNQRDVENQLHLNVK